ncbi:MAG: Sec-independent protein translocase subunit TatA/TatB [Opitutaceae bacterium]
MHTLAFLQNLSSWEIVLIFLVVLLFFGAKRLPELFRSLGKSVKEFKSATSGIEEDIRSAMESEEPVKKPTPAAKVESQSIDSLKPEAKVTPAEATEKDKA